MKNINVFYRLFSIVTLVLSVSLWIFGDKKEILLAQVIFITLFTLLIILVTYGFFYYSGIEIWEKSIKWFRENKLSFFICLSFIVGVAIALLDNFDAKLGISEFWGGVLVEAHGMLLDIILFGIVLTLYENYHHKYSNIKHYKEEIDDHRRWNEPEPMFRIVGNLRRLIKAGVKNIDLNNCYLVDADLRELDLSSGVFRNSILRNAKFFSTNLKHSDFNGAQTYDADSSGADLSDTDFRNCHLADIVINKDTKVNNMMFSNDKTFDNRIFIMNINKIFEEKVRIVYLETNSDHYKLFYHST